MGCITHKQRKEENTLDSTPTNFPKDSKLNYKVSVDEKLTLKNI